MNFEPFYELCRFAPENDKPFVDALCRELEDVFQDERYEDIQKVCHLFRAMSSCTAKTQYFRNKKYIISLYRWFLQQNIISQEFFDKVSKLGIGDLVTEEELSKYYFKSLDSVLAYIERTAKMRGQPDDSCFQLVKVVAILSWHQVDIEEMCQIKKSDLDIVNNTIHIHGDDERFLSLDDKYFDRVLEYARAEFFYSFPSTNKMEYRDTDYLLRTSRNDRMTRDGIKFYMTRFNENAVGVERLSLNPLKRNGAFYETYKHSGEFKTINMAIMHFAKCEKSTAVGYSKMYIRWKENFYGGDIVTA